MFCTLNIASAQVFATTSNGDQVILNKDGTWKQIDTTSLSVTSLLGSLYPTSIIYSNEKKFSKAGNATHLIKSKKLPVGFYVNNKYWGMRRGQTNDNFEFYFFNKIDEGYAHMEVNTTKGLSLENMREDHLRSIRKIMPDAVIKLCEYRNINGLKILCTDIIGTLDNYKGEFFTYTFVSNDGIVDIQVTNSQEKFIKYRDVYEEFLNGLVSL